VVTNLLPPRFNLIRSAVVAGEANHIWRIILYSRSDRGAAEAPSERSRKSHMRAIRPLSRGVVG
jgi:hypothetical protein